MTTIAPTRVAPARQVPAVAAAEAGSRRLTVHPVALVARALALLAGVLPAQLPHSAYVQAGVVVAFLLVAQPVVRLGRRLRPAARTGAGLAGTVGLALAVGLPLEVAATERLRASAGMPSAGPAYWLAVAVLTAAVFLLPRAVALGVRRSRSAGRLRGWRSGLLVTLCVVLAGAALSGFAPGPGSRSAGAVGAPERPLTVASPVGAVRVYAASRAGESLTARAERAADALVAAGGLERRHVVLMLPTGSGWVDPTAVAGFEERFGRDVSEVSMQSTAVPSWIAYLFQRDAADSGAQALFTAVADRIAALPAGSRPQLHLYGQSLGASTGRSVLTSPATAARAEREVCSVLWVGMPGGHGIPASADGPKEAMVANPTDPVVHTHLADLVRDPGDGRTWLPLVSFVQDGADFVASRSVPVGVGHRYGESQAAALPTC